MRVAVTGAAGLIGGQLVDALAGDDRLEQVLAIDVRAPARPPDARVQPLQRDTRDPRLRGDLAGIDALVHLAFREIDAADAVHVNVDGSRNVFEAAIAAGAATIVYASSGSIYGSRPDNPVPLREDHPIRHDATFAYPRTKAIVEGMLDELAERHPDVRTVRIRPTTALGPGMPLLLARRAYISLSDFDPLVQFTWVDDVAAAFAAALHASAATGVFNVGAPGPVPASEVAGILGVRGIRLPYLARRRAQAALKRLHVPGGLDPRFVDTTRYPIVVDSSRAEAELGWRPARDTTGALRRFRETL